jgi:hypothetical protein
MPTGADEIRCFPEKQVTEDRPSPFSTRRRRPPRRLSSVLSAPCASTRCRWPSSAASTLSSAVTRSRRVKVLFSPFFLSRFSRLLTRLVTVHCAFAALVFCTSASRPSSVAETNTDLFSRLSFSLFLCRFSLVQKRVVLLLCLPATRSCLWGPSFLHSTRERKEGKKSDGCEWTRTSSRRSRSP